MYKRDAAQIRRGHKTRHISHHAATDRHEQGFAIGSGAAQSARDEFDAVQRLGRFRVVKEMCPGWSAGIKSRRNEILDGAPRFRRGDNLYAGKIAQTRNLSRGVPQYAMAADYRISSRRRANLDAFRFHVANILNVTHARAGCISAPLQ